MPAQKAQKVYNVKTEAPEAIVTFAGVDSLVTGLRLSPGSRRQNIRLRAAKIVCDHKTMHVFNTLEVNT